MTYSPFRHLPAIFYKNKPLHLTVFLTKRCNARCSFCFYLDHELPLPQGYRELSTKELDTVASSFGRLLWLAFSGGEIFLRDDLVAITRSFYLKNKPVIILLSTNGLLPSIIPEKVEAILRECPKSTVVVKLSIDGPEEVHDTIRGVPGSYQRVLETHRLLGPLLEKYRNFELGINTVCCAANQKTLLETIDFVNTLPWINTHTVSLVRGRGAISGGEEVDPTKYEAAIAKLESNQKQKTRARAYRFAGAGIKAAQDILQRRLIYQTVSQNSRQLPCYAGRLNLVLTEQGDLYPCEEFNETMRLGNVRDFGLDAQLLLSSPRAAEVLRQINDSRCYCTHECYMMTNILFNPGMYPALLQEYLKCLGARTFIRHGA